MEDISEDSVACQLFIIPSVSLGVAVGSSIVSQSLTMVNHLGHQLRYVPIQQITLFVIPPITVLMPDPQQCASIMPHTTGPTQTHVRPHHTSGCPSDAPRSPTHPAWPHACMRPPWTHLTPSRHVVAPFDAFQRVPTCTATPTTHPCTQTTPHCLPGPPLDMPHPIPHTPAAFDAPSCRHHNDTAPCHPTTLSRSNCDMYSILYRILFLLLKYTIRAPKGKCKSAAASMEGSVLPHGPVCHHRTNLLHIHSLLFKSCMELLSYLQVPKPFKNP